MDHTLKHTENQAAKTDHPRSTFFGRNSNAPFFHRKSTINNEGDLIQRSSIIREIGTHLFPGTVTNNHTSPIKVWSGDFGAGGCVDGNFRFVQPGASMGGVSDWLDIDHLQTPDGRWFKIGWNDVVVNMDGSVSNAKCQVSDCGQDCPQRPQRQRFLDGSYIDDQGNWQPGIGPKY